MKIPPITCSTTHKQNINFSAKISPENINKFKSAKKDFLEAGGVVCLTSIPMILVVLAHELWNKISENRNKK